MDDVSYPRIRENFRAGARSYLIAGMGGRRQPEAIVRQSPPETKIDEGEAVVPLAQGACGADFHAAGGNEERKTRVRLRSSSALEAGIRPTDSLQQLA